MKLQILLIFFTPIWGSFDLEGWTNLHRREYLVLFLAKSNNHWYHWLVVFNMFYYFHPYLGKINPIWRAYVSKGLVQPPTRNDMHHAPSENEGKFPLNTWICFCWWLFLPFYCGKSPFFTTIWGICFNFFPTPSENSWKSKQYNGMSQGF